MDPRDSPGKAGGSPFKDFQAIVKEQITELNPSEMGVQNFDDEISRLKRESDDFDQGSYSRKISQIQDEMNTDNFEREIHAKAEDYRKLKDEFTREQELKDLREREILLREGELEEKLGSFQAEKDKHQNTVKFKSSLFSAHSENQDFIISDLEAHLEMLKKNLSRVQSHKEALMEELKSTKKSESTLDNVVQTSENLIKETSKAPFDEIKLKTVKRENNDLKYRVEQAVKELDDAKGQLS